jgi:methylmalonyl-CoA/ethylmalonyl-CoA epimerase
MRIDHIAIAVHNLEEAIVNYRKVLKADDLNIEAVHSEKVRVAMIRLNDTRIELMEPTADDSPIKKFLVDRGEGIHHIAITVDEIEKDVARATENGIKILGGLRSGSYGRRITFIHPKSMNGVLMELCEAPSWADSRGSQH